MTNDHGLRLAVKEYAVARATPGKEKRGTFLRPWTNPIILNINYNTPSGAHTDQKQEMARAFLSALKLI